MKCGVLKTPMSAYSVISTSLLYICSIYTCVACTYVVLCTYKKKKVVLCKKSCVMYQKKKLCYVLCYVNTKKKMMYMYIQNTGDRWTVAF